MTINYKKYDIDYNIRKTYNYVIRKRNDTQSISLTS